MGGVDSLISLGRIGRAHGIRGEVKVTPLTDRPEVFRGLRSVYVDDEHGHGKWMEIERVRVQGERIVLKLFDVDDRDQAEGIREQILKVDEATLPVEEDRFPIHRLIGLDVITAAGERIGSLVDVLQMPSQDIYVVDADGNEVLIPAVKEFIKRIDIRNNEIIVEPIEGLLE